jgi:DNA-binding transcriptional regulator GbsR (MarR family)
MSSEAISTVIKMMESLPEDVQNQIAQHLHEYVQDLQDEIKWDNSFQKTQNKLVAAAQKAKQEIARGLSQPMDYDKL